MLHARSLSLPGLVHGFFTRRGGVSRGVYGSLNCGLGSHDERDRVLQNRAYVAGKLGIKASHLVTCYQAHTATCVTVATPFPPTVAPKADAMVTVVPGVALAVSSADCTPILLAAPEARVIGAVHAGWRGALLGVLEACVEAMVAAGAERGEIRAAIGPTISQPNYEVGAELLDAFVKVDPGFARFFGPGVRDGKAQFDLPGLVAHRLTSAGIREIEDLALCTYADEARFFSYRRMTHRGEADYGRHLHAIALA